MTLISTSTDIKQSAKKTMALFDFDGTISFCDSMMLFLRSTYGLKKTIQHVLSLWPYFLGSTIKIVDRSLTKEKLFSSFFKGWTDSDLTQVGNNFAKGSLNKIIRPAAIDRIKWHQQQGHQVVVISASPELWIVPWSQALGLDYLATRFEYKNAKFTGKFYGPNCIGVEKVRRFIESFGDPEQYYLYVYGDSSGDKELLAIANEKFYKPFRC